MNGRARATASILLLALSLASAAVAQVVIKPTAQPPITAENERWFLDGDPITYAGALYYPAGAQIFFNPNEMVRSGFYEGIPLYARTTIEPYSVVYVPLAGGRMQPYERPRDGELAGTAGSMPSSVLAAPVPVSTVGSIAMAAGPPAQTAAAPGDDVVRAVGTSGVSRPLRRAKGTSVIFIELWNSRWYPAGPAEGIDTSRLTRVGSHLGFEVWAERPESTVIYLPVTRGGSLAVPYSRTRRR